ncbi:GIY-YIG nuclease family protein [Rugamonas apoptosis]|uniref:GIY-YIG nuclease family protein n=1 Tax=Rugamonas apoptosis TaxID=2758570 RepID=A0A7W2IM60_9BURK|nr:GIY-YIG nuclease family protein [Rugamonas apoptosis]MBA5689147.1 GIY-YIG nuclease family protein [Rugamonas apoptosis]
MPSSPHFKEFEFDLPRALLRDLVALLDGLGSAPLESRAIETQIPEEQGVYQLFLDDKLVYIGKTDAEAGLRARLSRHSRKILQRKHLDPARVSFKAVRIFVFTAVDLETLLITYYSDRDGRRPSWNSSGFGSNDPGRERDTTRLKVEHFDAQYPIDIDNHPIEVGVRGEMSAATLLAALNKAVPFIVRTQNAGGRSRQPHADLETTKVSVPEGPHSARAILRMAASALGPAWQITVLPGYVIVYKEQAIYHHAQVL